MQNYAVINVDEVKLYSLIWKSIPDTLLNEKKQNELVYVCVCVCLITNERNQLKLAKGENKKGIHYKNKEMLQGCQGYFSGGIS